MDLAFDRAIAIEEIDGTQIIVKDAQDLGQEFDGSGGASLINATTVRLMRASLLPTPPSVMSSKACSRLVSGSR